ncbi:hypothetical protein, partial [Bacillus sp. 491mf]|uniref:hypothetical protein n=1 Tax=Bacillus sp. 491mf TaxID=1761755 RepID=UPI002737DC84
MKKMISALTEIIFFRFIPLFVGSNTPASKFSGSIVQLQRLESPVVSPPRTRQKAPLCQGRGRPAILS